MVRRPLKGSRKYFRLCLSNTDKPVLVYPPSVSQSVGRIDIKRGCLRLRSELSTPTAAGLAQGPSRCSLASV